MNTCESILYNEFVKPNGYYTFLSQKCATCHHGLGEAPGFSSENTLIAWEKFVDKEINSGNRVSERAVSDHQPGVTGTQNKTIIDRLKEQFATSQIKYDECEEESGNLKVVLTPLKTTTLSLAFLKPNGEDLTDAEKTFLRSETMKYYVEEKTPTGGSTGIYVEKLQVLTNLNPYERPIFDVATNTWKKVALKKVSSLDLNDEESGHIRVENYPLVDAAGKPILKDGIQIIKAYFLNPFERIKKDVAGKIIVDPKTFEPLVEKLARGGEYAFNLRSSIYTPELNLDEPHVTFKVQLFRSQKPINKTGQAYTLKKRVNATTTQTITFTQTTGYVQSLDPYVVIKRPSFILNTNTPSSIYPKYAYQIQDLGLILNSKLQTDRTIYRILDSVVCNKTPINVMVNSNAEILSLDFSKPNSLQFEFKNVATIERADFTELKLACSEDEKLSDDVILPDRVTYQELMGATDVNVFKKSCVSCHSATNLAGGFDISSYDKAKSKNSKIVERMSNANSPMPPSGILNPTSRKLVQKWMSLGSPL